MFIMNKIIENKCRICKKIDDLYKTKYIGILCGNCEKNLLNFIGQRKEMNDNLGQGILELKQRQKEKEKDSY